MPLTVLEKAIAERNKGTLGINTITRKTQSHSTTSLKLHQVDVFIEELNKYWDFVEESHIRIMTLDQTNAATHESEWDRLFEIYTTTKCELRSIKATLTPASVPQKHHSEIKLPKFHLPQFTGEVHEWISFRDMYLAAIHHNTDLSDAQKFTYLRSSLSGNAAKLIKSLTISDANYNIAWETVKKRFENKRELYFSIMKRFTALPNISSSTSSSLRTIVDAGMECIRSLDTLKIQDKWDAILVFTLTQKLDSVSREQWELSLKDAEIPTSKALLEFIEQRARSIAASTSDSGTRKKDMQQRAVTLHTKSGALPTDGECSFCSGSHFNFRCPTLLAMKLDERRSIAQQKGLCFNCLRMGHRVVDCQLGKSCKTCGKRHHSLLHPDRSFQSTGIHSTKQPITSQASQSSNQQSTLSSNHQATPSSNHTPVPVQNYHNQETNYSRADALLATAIIRVKTAKGGYLRFRTLLDGGSTVSCISENCIGQLGLDRERVDTEVIGLGSVQLGKTRGLTPIHFKASHSEETIEQFSINAYVLKKITCQLPTKRYNVDTWHHLKQLRLADPNFHIPADIDILLGADIFFKLLLPEKRPGQSRLPDAVNSKLGWLVSGPVDFNPPRIQVHHITVNLEETMNRFWELEQIPKRTIMTPEEVACEDDFAKSHYRNQEGRFIVRIPMKVPKVPLGESRDIAKRRLKQIEKKLALHPALQSLYQEFMEQYESLGHMRKLAPETSSNQRIYIPHHCVLKDWSQANKFRVVFDASSKTSSGFSLNDAQMVGPVTQDTLYAIIMRFRIHRFAFSADITKMYRQILVAPDQRDFQCILWRSAATLPIQEYKLITVTYGTASAPFLATRVLQQLGTTETSTYPLGAAIIKRDFYMDDVMSGEQSIKSTKRAITEIRALTDSAGFTLSKFASNSPECLAEIPRELRETKEVVVVEEDSCVKTLGLYWDTERDQLRFKVQVPTIYPTLTKRLLLSEIGKIFDPMGWLAPTVVRAKILMQEVWKEKTTWDEQPSLFILNQWRELQESFNAIQDIRIERWMHYSNAVTVLELHGFSDASEKAYAGVIYVRSVDTVGNINISLLTAKTKVAPANKVISIPRLELCGALLLADLMETVQGFLKLPFTNIQAWTDSTIVLCWLNSCPRRWKTFVANRVTRIQEVIPGENWRHVPGNENPADIASRGISGNDLRTHPLWWNGPSWLLKDTVRSDQPMQDIDSESINKAEDEERDIVIITKTHISDMTMLTRYSTLLRLRRITAWIFRFIQNCLSKYKRRLDPQSTSTLVYGPLTSKELEEATLVWIKKVQASSFTNEIETLQTGETLSTKSKLLNLRPVLDEHGILRVGGRLKHATFGSDIKHPIVLPRHHRFTEMIIQEAHVQYLHAGPQLVHSILAIRYWIMRARDAIRHQIRKCIPCTRYRAQTVTQLMGDLPRSRLQYCRAFTRTGVDYAGPFQLRPMAPRSKTTYKAYIALFVCFITRALHLEIVSSQTTDAFIAALRRFTSRRGKPSDIYSDCGTNFVGAARELKDFERLVQSSKHNEIITNQLSAQGITWHFNPPGAPHCGGIWEAGVKSVKYHLHRVVGQTRLTYEEFSTITTQIEGCLNSRPLTPLSSDPTDLQALTPGHFLIGDTLQSIPDPDLAHLPISRLHRWQLLQKLQQDVQKRWLREYVTRLQQRPKWMQPQRNISVGDMVLVKSDVCASSSWPLARVIQIHPGQDQYTRVVTLRTSKGEIKRPVVKLCLLPLDQENQLEERKSDQT